MLKKMRLGGIVFASLLAVTGCQNEEIVSNKQQKGNYSLKVSSLVDSRTYVESDGTVKWSKGDKLYVYGEGVSGVLTLQGNGGGTTGTFSGFVFGDPDDLKWAVFGDEVKGTTDGAQFTISSITDPNSNSPMVGEIEGGNVEMEHLCGMVRITINNLPEGADVKLKGTDIGGTAEWNGSALTHTSKKGEISLVRGEGSDNIFEIPLFTTAPKEGPEEQKSLVLSVDGVECPINAPVKVGSLSQKAIMAITCITNAEGKVTGFSQAATTEEALKQAIESLKSGESISFSLADDMILEEAISVPEGATVILNLAGNTITAGSDGYVINNDNGGTLKITDETNEGAITGVVYTGSNSTTTIEGGTYNAVEGGKYVFLNSEGTLTINKANINGGSNYPIYSYGAGHKLVINDAIVNATFGCVNAYGINGIVEINGGTYTMTGVQGKSSHIVYCSNGDFTINGGNFNKEGNIGMSGTGGGGVCAIYGAKLTINGGNFAGDYADVYNWDGTNSDGRSVSIEIKGGSFKFNPNSKMIADGYKAVEKQGVYYVAPESANDVVSVNNASDLVSSITEGNYAVLNENITVTEENLESITENVTGMINLNGYKIEATISTTNSLKAALNIGATEINANNSTIGNLNYGLSKANVPAGTTVTIKNAVVNGKSYGNAVDGTVIFEGCTFSNSGAYTIHFDDGSGNVVFNNCNLDGWCSFGSAIQSVEMNDCTFRGNGTYAMLRFYQDVTLTGCTFDCSNANTEDVYPEGIDIMEGYTATIVNCTNVNGEMTNLFEEDDLKGTDGIVIFK